MSGGVLQEQERAVCRLVTEVGGGRGRFVQAVVWNELFFINYTFVLKINDT